MLPLECAGRRTRPTTDGHLTPPPPIWPGVWGGVERQGLVTCFSSLSLSPLSLTSVPGKWDHSNPGEYSSWKRFLPRALEPLA